MDDLKQPHQSWQAVNINKTKVSAVSFYFAKSIQEKLGVPVGLIVSAWGGSLIGTWIPKEGMPSGFNANIDAENSDEKEFAKIWNENSQDVAQQLTLDAMSRSPSEQMKKWAAGRHYWRPLQKFPSWTYNAKISPLKPFTLKGVIWYQGEENHSMGMKYADYLTALIKSWRQEWGQEFPFFIVMIAPYKYQSQEQLPEFWMAQLASSRKAGNSEVVCTVDLGDPTNLHPSKKEPGRPTTRLAVLKRCFGAQNSSPGPMFKAVSFQGKIASVLFDNCAGGLKIDGASTGFEIAGLDKKFSPGKAVVIAENSIAIQSDSVDEPRFVRYAWNNTPVPSLYNSEGLPAIPFSTAWK